MQVVRESVELDDRHCPWELLMNIQILFRLSEHGSIKVEVATLKAEVFLPGPSQCGRSHDRL